MRNPKINYLVVSAFTFAMLGAVIGGIVFLGGAGGPTKPYHLVLDNVSDIKFGTQVRYEGYPIGQIDRIAPFEEGGRMRFRIELSIDEDWALPTDSVARIGASNLLSAKTIDITAGRDRTLIAAGGQIPAAPPVDMFSVISQVAEQFGDLSQSSLKPMVDDVRTLANRLGKQVEADLGALLGALNDTALDLKSRTNGITADVASLAKRLNAASAGMQRLMGERNVRSVEQTLAHVETASRDFAATSAALRDTRARVDALLTDINKVVADNAGNIDKSITNVQYTLRSIASTIDSVMVNVDSTSRNMSEFSRLIRQNPGLLLSSSQPEPVSGGARRRPGVAN